MGRATSAQQRENHSNALEGVRRVHVTRPTSSAGDPGANTFPAEHFLPDLGSVRPGFPGALARRLRGRPPPACGGSVCTGSHCVEDQPFRVAPRCGLVRDHSSLTLTF